MLAGSRLDPAHDHYDGVDRKTVGCIARSGIGVLLQGVLLEGVLLQMAERLCGDDLLRFPRWGPEQLQCC